MPDEGSPLADSDHSLLGRERKPPTTRLPVADVSSKPALRLSRISKRFGPLRANDAISFDLEQSEVIALLGENGAGKTTLMNILFGHYVADEGTVEAFGKPLPPGDPRAAIDAGIGMVHQHFTLADNMTVLENIALGTQSLWRLRLDRTAARRRIEQLSADFGLSVDPAATISSLSVGERQRVEILKALYREARILILDEPTAVLTPVETEALFRTLKLLVAKGLSIIFISHKLHEVMAVSDRVLVLRSGQLVGERETRSTDRKELAALMVGREVKPTTVSPLRLGGPLLALEQVSATPYNGRASTNCRSRLQPEKSPALPVLPVMVRLSLPPSSPAYGVQPTAGFPSRGRKSPTGRHARRSPMAWPAFRKIATLSAASAT